MTEEKKYGLSEKTLITLEDIFKKYPSIEKVVLYGSRAKGTFKNGSDIDITLFTDNNFTYQDLSEIHKDFYLSNIPYTADISIYSKLTNENLKEHINRVGKILYQKK
ncbi:MAG: nucleotidyltransferase domain-containing protein [Elusimicrobiota bacterium]|jgi:predicted nucleotidyltransferase|nr:nucleotidyltransferase domain-containing protein [Elusimicrobiota bacterium]